MSTMVTIDCEVCGVKTGEVSIYDLPYISNNTCWDCADEALYAFYQNSLIDWELVND